MSGTGTAIGSGRSLRRAYLDWVEDRIEDHKESMPRDRLLDMAAEVIEELRVGRRGQYQITEVLVAAAVDRKIFRVLGLPGYRRWRDGLPDGEVPPA